MPVIHKTKFKPSKEINLPDKPILEIENLKFSYPDGRIALKGISLSMEPGEKIALVGPNGSGKSTLMLHVIGILKGSGTIHTGGLEVIDKNLPTIRANIGFVFQNPDDQLFSPTVFEDVAFGPLHMGLPEEEVCKRVEIALNQVNMGDFAERLSHRLSDGEKKQIAVATVLSMQPNLLLLDEPTAGLDPRSRRNLINLLRELPQSMLVATHDLAMVKELFPRIVFLDEGLIVANGKTAELLRDPELLEKHGLDIP